MPSKSKSKPKSSQTAKVRTTAITPTSIATSLVKFSPNSPYYAHLQQSPDAHTLRVYDTTTGKCISRWASNAVGDEEEVRVASLEWVLLPSATGGFTTAAALVVAGEDGEAEKRGKKRRKSDSAAGEEGETSSGAAGPEKKEELVVALGLTNGSVLIWSPLGAIPSFTISHPTSVSPVTALVSPSLTDKIDQRPTGHLWSSHADGSVRLWDITTRTVLGSVKGLEESTTWDDLAVRYVSGESDEKIHVQLLLSHLSLHFYSLSIPSPHGKSPTKKSKLREFTANLIGTCTGHIEPCSVQFAPSPSSPSSENDDVDEPESISNPLVTFLSFSPSDRFIQIWTLPATTTTAQNGTLQARLGLSTGIHSVALCPSPLDPEDESILFATSTAGQVALARLPVEFEPLQVKKGKASGGVRKLETECEIVGANGTEAGVVGVAVGQGIKSEEGARIVVARGAVKPVFEEVIFADENGLWIPKIEIARASNGLLNGSADNSSIGAPLPTRYVEPPSSTARSGDALPSTLPDSDEDEDMLANSGALDVDLAEPTLAERLKALNVSKAAAAAADEEALSVSGSDDDDESNSGSDNSDDDDEDGEEKSPRTSIPSTTLTTTLIQALHSSDAPLLESCLAQTSPSLIRATVKRLPSGSLVLSLLEVLVERLGRGKSGKEGSASVRRARGLVEWVRQVLIVHVGFLVTIPSLVTRLSALHSSLSTRLSLQPTLLSLHGRLELVMSQIDLRQERSKAKAVESRSSKKTEKSKVYVEGESSDEESGSGESDDGEEEDEEGSVEDVVLGSDGEEMDSDEDSEEGREFDNDDEVDEDDEDMEDEEMEELRAMGGSKKSSKKGKAKINVADMLDLEASEDDEDGSEGEDDEDEDGEGDSEDDEDDDE